MLLFAHCAQCTLCNAQAGTLRHTWGEGYLVWRFDSRRRRSAAPPRQFVVGTLLNMLPVPACATWLAEKPCCGSCWSGSLGDVNWRRWSVGRNPFIFISFSHVVIRGVGQLVSEQLRRDMRHIEARTAGCRWHASHRGLWSAGSVPVPVSSGESMRGNYPLGRPPKAMAAHTDVVMPLCRLLISYDS